MIRTITSVAMLCVAGAIFYFYTEPTYTNIQTTQAQNAQYDSALNKAAELQALKQSLLSKYNSLDPSEVSRLQTMLPDQINDIGQILDLDTLAGRYNMSLENVDVNTVGDGSSTTGTPGIAAVGASVNLYNTLKMKFTVHGNYATFLQFLSGLESSLSLVDIQSIQMVPSNVSVVDTSSAARIYGFTVTLNMYWLK